MKDTLDPEVLMARLRAGTLEYTFEHAEQALRMFLQSVMFDACLKDMGLEGLPDPDELPASTLALKEWLVQAMIFADKQIGKDSKTGQECIAMLDTIVEQHRRREGISAPHPTAPPADASTRPAPSRRPPRKRL
jgi:hypothetical protein